MSAAAATADNAAQGAKPAKSKKLIIIVAAAVLLLGGAGGGWFYLQSQKVHEDDEVEVKHSAPAPSAKEAPTFLPLENMVVNLADPGGERYLQVGVTLRLADAKSGDQVKVYLPSIRNGILMIVSQRTTQELLQLEGKQKLAKDIQDEVSRQLGFEPEDEATAGHGAAPQRKPRKRGPASPVQEVLFASFIVQ